MVIQAYGTYSSVFKAGHETSGLGPFATSAGCYDRGRRPEREELDQWLSSVPKADSCWTVPWLAAKPRLGVQAITESVRHGAASQNDVSLPES